MGLDVWHIAPAASTKVVNIKKTTYMKAIFANPKCSTRNPPTVGPKNAPRNQEDDHRPEMVKIFALVSNL